MSLTNLWVNRYSHKNRQQRGTLVFTHQLVWFESSRMLK